MKSYKIQIFPKNEDFETELIVFLFKNSPSLKREFSIDNILKKENSPNVENIYSNIKSFFLIDVFGSTFQSHWRNNRDIYAISHTVNEIYKEGEYFFANVTPSEYGDIIDFDKAILRPIYYRKNDSDDYEIVTFDIDFNITKDINT